MEQDCQNRRTWKQFTATGAKDVKDWGFTADGAEIAEASKGVLVPIFPMSRFPDVSISRWFDLPIGPSVFIRREVLPFNSGDFGNFGDSANALPFLPL